MGVMRRRGRGRIRMVIVRGSEDFSLVMHGHWLLASGPGEGREGGGALVQLEGERASTLLFCVDEGGRISRSFSLPFLLFFMSLQHI